MSRPCSPDDRVVAWIFKRNTSGFLCVISIIGPSLSEASVRRSTSPLSWYIYTSWPARRCPGIRAPRWTVLELSRFAITQPRDELFIHEKDCFSLKCVVFAGGCLSIVFLHAFFSCLFRVSDGCAVLFFVCSSCQFLSSSEKKKKDWLDIHTFLVSCPSQHHLRKERSSAPSKCCSLDNSRKERHGVVKDTFMLFSAVTPQSDG